MKNMPKLTEIVNYNGNEKIESVNWEKFYQLEELSRNSSSEIRKKANRYLGYFIWYLSRNNFLRQLPGDAYVICSSNFEILSLTNKNINYGFCHKEDALKYTKAAYPKTNNLLSIIHYEEK